MSKKMFQYEDSWGDIQGYGEKPICGFEIKVVISERVDDKDFEAIDSHTEAIEEIVKKYEKKAKPVKGEEE